MYAYSSSITINKMRNYIILIALLFSQYVVQSQCIVDAGRNVNLCIDNWGKVDSVPLQAKVLTGFPAKIVKWAFDYHAVPLYGADSMIFTADTTLHTFITNFHTTQNNKYYPIYIDVTDSMGNHCRDSLRVRTSKFAYLAFDCVYFTAPHEKQALHPNGSGGIPPLTRTILPPYYNVDTLAWKAYPDTTHVYYFTGVDSVGCRVDTSYCSFHVQPTGITDINTIHATLYPHPVTHSTVLRFDNTGNKTYTLFIYDIMGRELVQRTVTAHEISIADLLPQSGSYILTLRDKETEVYHIHVVRP
jgi:hypothetical protein